VYFSDGHVVHSAEVQRLLGSRGNVRIVAAFVRKVLDPATRSDGNGKASKVQASIGRGGISYVNMLARLEECTRVERWASQANHQANMPLIAVQQIIYNQHRLGLQTLKEKQGAKKTVSKDREKKHPGSEEDGAARPTASARNLKLRSQDQVESPVATRYVLDSDSE